MTARARVTLAQLEALVAAAEESSLTVAAERLRTSQSNVSVAVAKLERALGVELLVRQRAKGVALSVPGREAVARARVVLDAVRELEEFAGVRGGLEGELKVGCYLPLTPFFVPALLEGMRRHAPDLTVTVVEAALDALQRGVLEGELDLALVYDQSLPAQLAFVDFVRVRPYVIVSARSALAARDRVSLAELAGHTMVTYELPFTVDRAQQLFLAAGLQPPAQVRVASVDSVRALVAAGVGFSVLNQRWATTATADGSEVVDLDLADDVAPLRLGAIVRPATRNPRVGHAIGVLRRHARLRHPGPPGEPPD
ncbi:MAG: LysR family transcriptional regulator [Microbacterium sp.]|uniref:LysR family transcriptional regulator n=1 Tax=Microbacterium sp. TaxID=51671 RepID=UPI0039E364EC